LSTLYSRNNHKSFSIQNFTDQILSHANTTFSTMHARFLKKIWGDNTTTKKLHSNQVFTDWQNGTYEAYIPTRDSVDNNLEYSRIAIQILPMVSNEEKYQEAYKLGNPIKLPHGKIESELLILIAPRQHHWGLVKGFKHRNKPGYFTGVFVNASPDIIWKRVLDHITNFFEKRLNGLMDSLKIERWVWKWSQQKENNMLYYRILEHFSYVIRQSAFTFLKLYQHFIQVQKAILNEIGIQSVAKQAIKPLLSLNPRDLQRAFCFIREDLKANLENTAIKFKPEELRLLEAIRHG
jgi:hypothetical protein